ncbi:hypothetical protein D3C75_655600 [compost metagenome]
MPKPARAPNSRVSALLAAMRMREGRYRRVCPATLKRQANGGARPSQSRPSCPGSSLGQVGMPRLAR